MTIQYLSGGRIQGLSSDSKPTNVPDGSMFFETNTDFQYVISGGVWSQIFAAAGVPSGTIAMWSGTLAAIPSGWSLCDGTGGTPNLIASFIRGVATSGTNPGSTGGSDTETLTAAQSGMPSHGHSVSDPGHTHTANSRGNSTYSGSYFRNHAYGGTNITTNSSTTGISVSNAGAQNASSSHNNMPVYYELAYIMKD